MLKGKWHNADDAVLYIYYNNIGYRIKDSAVIKNGKFIFRGNLNEPAIATITGINKNTRKSVSVEYWLEPGKMEMIIENGDFQNIFFKGSKINNDFNEFKKIKESVNRKYQNQLDSLKGVRDMDIIAGIRGRLGPYFSELEKEEINYFNRHPKSYITAYMLSFYTSKLSLDSLKLFYEQMTTNLKQSSYGKYLNSKIIQIENGSPGSLAKNFTTKDLAGLTLSLNDFKGSFVLLDFWASWCVPCRKEHPQMIELYNKYKAKGIYFIGIADDDGQQEKWREAVKKDNLPWHQVLRGRNLDGNPISNRPVQDINEFFGIQSLPTIILINEKGTIVGRYEENIDDLIRQLELVFKDKQI